MRLTTPIRASRWLIFLAANVGLRPAAWGGDNPPAPDSALVRLLRGGRVPEARQGTIVEMIGQRGTAEDLGYLYHRALTGGFPPAVAVKALDALAEAALTRGLKPARDRERLIALLPADSPRSDLGSARAVVRLVGL